MSDPAFDSAITNPFGLINVGFRAAPTLADIDGDGDLDAIVGDGLGNTQYFENTGSASSAAFASAVTIPFGLIDVGSNASPALVDIDGDGDLDAFLGAYDGNTLYVQNTGSAGSAEFGSAQTNPFGLINVGVRAFPSFADVDDDGDLDAFVGESTGNILYFQNTGSAGSAAFAAALTNPFGLSDVGNRAAPSFADTDGDGDLDAFVGNLDGHTLYFENTGNASSAAFASRLTNPFGLSDVGGSAAPSFADIDADGDLDAFVGNNDGDTLVFLNRVPGIHFTQGGGNSVIAEGGAPGSFALVLNEAPAFDVVITLDDTNVQVSLSASVLTFTTANWFTAQTVTVTALNDSVGEGAHTGIVKFSVASLDSGYNGMVVAPVIVSVTDNDLPVGEPLFGTASSNPYGLAVAGSFADPTLADIDGDGDMDAFVGVLDGNTQYFQNTGNASSAAYAAGVSNPFGLSDVGSLASPTFADIDSDGDLDAFVGAKNGNTLYFQNTGSASSAAFSSSVTNPFGLSDVGASAAPTFADIDGDGDLDAFIGNLAGDTLYFQNTGGASSAAFDSSVSNPFGLSDVGYVAAPTFADIDGDGDLDAFVGDDYGNTQYFENTGSASSAAFASSLTNPFGLSDAGFSANPSFADIDADGDLDAFVGSSSGNVLVSLNRTPEILITQSGGSTAVAESGATDSFTLVLDEAPTLDVVITLDDTNGQVSLSASVITFTSANWNIAQTVTPTAVNDSVGEGAHTGAVTFSVASADSDYDGLMVAPVIVAVADNDLPVGDPQFGAPNSNPFGLIDVGSFADPTFADIDGDGDLDAFVGELNNKILYFENAGSASSAAYASAASNPFGLSNLGFYATPTLADIDGDGDLDAFVGEAGGNTLYFQNNGSASSAAFASSLANPFGLSDVGFSARPSFADIDGDGDLDAFVGEEGGSTRYFQNTGSASSAAFAAPQTNPFGLSSVAEFAAPGFTDIDGDGDLDAFVGERYGDTLYFQNTGSASSAAFASAQTNPFGLGDVGSFAVPTFADIDADGDLDALVGNSAGNTFLFLNRTPEVLIAQSANASAVIEGGATDSFTVVLDEAPSFDVVITLDDTNGQVSLSTSTLTFTADNWFTAQTVALTAVNDSVGEGAHSGVVQFSVASADGAYDAMALAPVIVAVADNDLPVVAPIFGAAIGNPFGLSDAGDYVAPTFADIDGDGDLDAFVGEVYGNTLYFQNTGSASSAAFESNITNPYGLSDVGFRATPSFADIDGDGDLDALVGNQDGNILYFQNTGSASSATFALAVSNPFGLSAVGYSASPTFADIDGDGDLDAFIGSNDGITHYFQNTGNVSSAAFESSVSNPFGLSVAGTLASPAFADIDGDGDLDAFVSNYDGDTLYFQNTGGVSSAAFASSLTNPFGLSDVGAAASLRLADIDGDGDLDAFVGNGGGNTLVFLNNQAPALATPAAITYTDTRFDDSFVNANRTLVGSDGDDDTLSYGITGGVDGGSTVSKSNAYGTLTVTKATGAAVFTPIDAAIEARSSNTSVNFTVTVSDGQSSASRTLTINLNQSGVTETNGNNTITGTSGADKFDALTGNDSISGLGGNDTLVGNAGNDILNGGTGTDSMNGGLGDDSYFVDIAGDIVTESSVAGTGGIDTINSGVTRTLGSFQEKLILTGSTAIHGSGNTLANTLTGNSGANSLNGSGGNDTLIGNSGNDTLNGGTGSDSMSGGLGDDTYFVDNALDIVTESSVAGTGGIDTISSIVTRTLGLYQEKLILTGSTAINGAGNTLANTITGNSGANSLSGSSGNDTLIGNGGADTLTGGTGKDSLTGGLGADRFDFNNVTESGVNSTTRDVIADFVAGQGDKIDLSTIDANTTIVNNQAFSAPINSATAFNATSSFTGANAGAGKLFYDQLNDVLYANVDGDAAAEFSVALAGVPSLLSGNLVL